jgi:hypothetical protein
MNSIYMNNFRNRLNHSPCLVDRVRLKVSHCVVAASMGEADALATGRPAPQLLHPGAQPPCLRLSRFSNLSRPREVTGQTFDRTGYSEELY